MTRMLGRGCSPIDVGAGILQGGEGSHDLVQLGALLAIADLRPPGAVHDTVDGIPGQAAGRKPAESAQSS